MKYIFIPKRDLKTRPYNIFVKYYNSAKYGDKSLIALGPKTLNRFLSNVKSLTSITKFKEYTRTWCVPSSKCSFVDCYKTLQLYIN